MLKNPVFNLVSTLCEVMRFGNSSERLLQLITVFLKSTCGSHNNSESTPGRWAVNSSMMRLDPAEAERLRRIDNLGFGAGVRAIEIKGCCWGKYPREIFEQRGDLP